MNNIDEIFRTALLYLLPPIRGAQATLARKAGVHPPYLNRIIKGGSGSDDVYRKIADALGYPGRKYEDFLEVGRAVLKGRTPPEPESHYVGSREFKDRQLVAIPFTENMKLAAGGGGAIPYDMDEDSSPVVVHTAALGRRNNHLLQAFRVGGDSMEPVIARGGIVVVDKSNNQLANIKEGKIYALCWDLHDGDCAVKRLYWADKGQRLALESENKDYPLKFMDVDDVLLIGRVIWSWREH